MAGAALGGKQRHGVVANARRDRIFAGQHEQLANGGVVERALDLARNKLVVADVDDFAVGLAHDAGDSGHVGELRRCRGGLHLRFGRPVLTCGLRRCGRVRSAILGVLVAAQDTGADAGDKQKHSRNGRGLQAGKVIEDALAEPLVPALAAAECRGLRQGAGERAPQDSDPAQRRDAASASTLSASTCSRSFWHSAQPVTCRSSSCDQFVGQLSVCRRDNPFVCKFAIHGYVLQASKMQLSASSF